MQDGNAAVYYASSRCPLGKIFVAATAQGICKVHLAAQGEAAFFAWLRQRFAQWEENPTFEHNRLALAELAEYFAGRRQEFSVQLDLRGTPFQQRVWAQLLTIPYGETRSYGEIARALGGVRYARAVGSANHHNPVPIIVPCHRVIGSNGQLTGYAGGVDLKARLLALEKNSLQALKEK